MSKKKFCILYIVGVLIFYLWYQAVVNVLYAGRLLAYDDFTDFLIGTLVNGSMLLLLFAINAVIVFGIKWRRNKTYRVFIDFALSFLAPLIVNGIFYLTALCFSQHGEVLWLQVYVVNVMIFMINETLFFIVNYKRQQQITQTMQRVSAQLEYDVLRAQLNPHFLFNSLNILHSLTFLDIEKSREFLLSLSSMYRYIMSRRAYTIVTVADEMEFLDSYLEVLKMLYMNCFEIEITGVEKYKGRKVVPYSLQLLIENVIKHNVINQEKPMTVHILMNDSGMEISNPLRPKGLTSNRAASSGIGLMYLSKLYELHGQKITKQKTDVLYSVRLPFLDGETTTKETAKKL